MPTGVDIQTMLRKLGIDQLNDMQRQTIEALMRSDGDVVLLSPTGTGKTLAYLLPLTQLLDADSDAVQALVVTPGRELALQSDTVLRGMGSGLRSASCYGGRATMDEHRTLKSVRPQVVFGTPGRLNDHLDKGNIDRHGVRLLIIDEFDKCLEMGFQGEMQKLVKCLPGLRRRVLLSATNSEEIPAFVTLRHSQVIDCLPHENQTTERVTLHTVHSPRKDKLDTLRELLLDFGDQSTIVFLNYRDSVERVYQYLDSQGFVASRLHGGLEQGQREDQLYRFSNASANILVATDLASRGLDIPDISNIVHYHLPESEEGYIHRVGRTARWNATGRTFFILSEGEQIPAYVEGTPADYQPTAANQRPEPPRMATVYIGKGKRDKISKGDIVGFLCKSGGLRADEIGRIDVRERYSYAAIRRTRLTQVLRQTRGEKIKGLRTVVEELR